MKSSLPGFIFLLGFIALAGSGSFLQKFSMNQLTPYQIYFLMALGMIATAVPALLIKQGDLTVPTKALSLGAPIALLMGLGSISYVLALSKIPAGTASAISTSHVIVVVLLSRLFLRESLGGLKVTGILLTIVGVALLSWEQSQRSG